MSNSYPVNPPSAGATSEDVVAVEEELVVYEVDPAGTQPTGKTGAAKQQAGQVAQGAADAGKHVAGVAKDQASTVASEAKAQAGNVADETKAQVSNVASEAKAQVSNVASEAKYQARDLLSQARSQVTEQASSQQKKAATGIRTIGDQLSGMASGTGTPEAGMAKDLIEQAATRLQGVASWIEEREPGDLLQEVRNFAARRPGTFIAIAAVAGVVAGRLTKSVVGAAADDKEDAAAETSVVPTYDATTSYDATATYPTSSTYVGDLDSPPVVGEGAGQFDPVYGQNEYGTGLGTGVGGSTVGDVRR